MRTELFGRHLPSPVIIGSGPMSYSAKGMIRLAQNGAGAVVTKTITGQAAVNPDNHMVKYAPGTLLNCEKWSDYPMEQWIEKEIPEAVSAGVNCIASVGHTVQDSSKCVERLEAEGCMAIELVSYRKETLLPMLKDTKKRVKIPVIVKLSPNVPDFLDLAEQCEKAGADAFTAFDSIGPAMRIDIESGRPALGQGDGCGWLTGEMIRPFIIAKVCELRKHTRLPIIGLGGIARWQDAVEMVMAGADYIGICSAVILQGPEMIRKLDQKVDEYLEKGGYSSLKDISGKVLHFLSGNDQRGSYKIIADSSLCTRCGKCVSICPYRAHSFDENGTLLTDEVCCRKCGLCVSACRALNAVVSD